MEYAGYLLGTAVKRARFFFFLFVRHVNYLL